MRKFEVDEDSFGSKPKDANSGFVIIPPPIPTIEEIIPATIAIQTTFTTLSERFAIFSSLNSGSILFLFAR